jgi:hypothetical protein
MLDLDVELLQLGDHAGADSNHEVGGSQVPRQTVLQPHRQMERLAVNNSRSGLENRLARSRNESLTQLQKAKNRSQGKVRETEDGNECKATVLLCESCQCSWPDASRPRRACWLA